MRFFALSLLASLLVAPAALAQGENAASVGNNSGAAGPQESIETGPTVVWYVFAFLGAAALTVTLIFVTTRRDRQRRRGP